MVPNYGPTYAGQMLFYDDTGWTGWAASRAVTGTATANTFSLNATLSAANDEPKPAPLAWLNSRVDDIVDKGKQALEAA